MGENRTVNDPNDPRFFYFDEAGDLVLNLGALDGCSGGSFAQEHDPLMALPSEVAIGTLGIPGISVPVDPPGPRLLRAPIDGEIAARDWLRWLGFGDAECTANGKDAGVDVYGQGVVAQVKMEARPSSRVQLQLLSGAAAISPGCQTVFFSLYGYTAEAVDWADQVAMALFTFDLQGQVSPGNAWADRLINAADTRRGPAVVPTPGGVWDARAGIYGSLEELPALVFQKYASGEGTEPALPENWRPLDWPLDEERQPVPEPKAITSIPPDTSDWEWLSPCDDLALHHALDFRRRLSPRPTLLFGSGQSGVGWAWLAFEAINCDGIQLYVVETAPLPAGRETFDLTIYGMYPPVTAYCTSLSAVLRYTEPWRRCCQSDDRLALVVSADERKATHLMSSIVDMADRRKPLE